MKLKFLTLLLLYTFHFALFTSTAYAIVDPTGTTNNKFGIHIISATVDESSPAANLVNSSGGDWGYVTVLIESKDRDTNKWQEFFNDLRRRHLIPIIRLATKPVDDHWELPYEKEYEAWADFLNNLIWPVKNRYVIVYNEPNHGKEWGGAVDPTSYAKVLDFTITALKQKSDDFFVLNAGFDASTPNQPPDFLDEEKFLIAMNSAVPGIFNKLDGWDSHSYPNPNFSGSPLARGRGTIRNYLWEQQILHQLGLTKFLPIFITETGWKHLEGITPDSTLPSSDSVGLFLQNAFEVAWNSSQIVAVTPFLLNYQEAPFDHFSFKKLTGEKQNQKILGIQYPEYYPQYQAISDLPKTAGQPVQEISAKLLKGEIFRSLVADQAYTIPFTFKNTGQSIWNDRGLVSLSPTQGSLELRINEASIPADKKIEPGGEYTFQVKLKAPPAGIYKVVLNLFQNGVAFGSPMEFVSEVKPLARFKVKTSLKWNKNPEGQYLLTVSGPVGDSEKTIDLKSDGGSNEVDAPDLLPDYTFDFTLSRPFYQPKVVRLNLKSGVNLLDFGQLQPDFPSAILNPAALWQLLPFSN